MKYKGYHGEVFYDEDLKLFSGRVANAKAVGTFYGNKVEDLENAFRETVDCYLEFCKEKEVEPEKPFSGKFNLRLNPDMHRYLYFSAKSRNKSINSLIVDFISEHIGKEV